MLEGNKFLPDTGMPMRKIACMRRPLALADPVPFTFASLRAKSFTRSRMSRHQRAAGIRPPRVRNEQLKLLHVPSCRGTALGTKAAVHAQVFVLGHDARGLGQRSGDVEVLRQVDGGRREALAQVVFLAVARDG